MLNEVIWPGSGLTLIVMGTAASSSFDDILSACLTQQVTGVLRVRDTSAETEAEIHFLSGVHDSVRLGPVEGEEALARISLMANPEFSATESLPPMSESSQTAFPKAGSLGDFRPVDLMRYCEVRCLTCTLHLYCADRHVKANYRQGELINVEPELDLTISLLEALEGSYRFELPTFALPDMSAPRAFDPDSAQPADDSETAECVEATPDEDPDAPSKPELKFTSIAAPPPDDSIALSKTVLNPTVADEYEQAEEAPPKASPPPSRRQAVAALQPPPPRAAQEDDVFASLSPELLQQVLEPGPSIAPPQLDIPRLAAYSAATLAACITLAFLSYSFLAPVGAPSPRSDQSSR